MHFTHSDNSFNVQLQCVTCIFKRQGRERVELYVNHHINICEYTVIWQWESESESEGESDLLRHCVSEWTRNNAMQLIVCKLSSLSKIITLQVNTSGYDTQLLLVREKANNIDTYRHTPHTHTQEECVKDNTCITQTGDKLLILGCKV